jgi:hypothetical protein
MKNSRIYSFNKAIEAMKKHPLSVAASKIKKIIQLNLIERSLLFSKIIKIRNDLLSKNH